MLFMKAKVPFSPALVLHFGDLVWPFWRACLALLASLFGPFVFLLSKTFVWFFNLEF